MKTLDLEQMSCIEGGYKASPEFIIMCGILSAALGTLTFGLGLLTGVACVALTAD